MIGSPSWKSGNALKPVLMAVGFVVLLSVGQTSAQSPMNALVLFKSYEMEVALETISAIKAMGVEVRVAVPPFGAFVFITHELEKTLGEEAHSLGIHTLFREKVSAKRLRGLSGEAASLAETWNRILEHQSLDASGKLPRPTVSLTADSFVPPPSELSFSRTIPLHSPPWGSVPADSSEYLLADPTKPISVMVSILFPESAGSGEDWVMTGTVFTDGWTVLGQVAMGLDFWARNAPLCAPLTFGITPPQQVTTTVEPITLRGSGPLGGCGGQEDIWITQIMASVCPGCVAPSYFDKVRAYDDKIRLAVDSDWAFTIFVVNSKNDPDGAFAPLPAGPPCNGGRLFGYAYLGGPFMVMTWDNDGYGINFMHTVAAHETGHIFYALDEYCCASSPIAKSGYLNVANTNHADSFVVCNCSVNPALPLQPYPGQPCIMRGDIPPFGADAICTFTRSVVGWRDLDLNGIMDILDPPPSVDFATLFFNPSIANQFLRPMLVFPSVRMIGTATCGTLMNENTQGLGNDITVSSVVSVQYRVDGGPFLNASPADGAFSSGREIFYFDTGPFVTGSLHDFDVFATCTGGCTGSMVVGPSLTTSVFVLPAPATCP